MEIKLRARLAAYSRMDSIENIANRVPHKAIDTLFDPKELDTIVSKEDINDLFIDAEPDRVVDKEEIDSLFQLDNDRKVTYAEIDSLFD